MSSAALPQARHWRSATTALEFVRRWPDPTRRELARELGLASGAASDLVARMRAARLVIEEPAQGRGPGRPTTRIRAHPEGPVVLVLDLRHADWRLAACGIDAVPEMLATGRHAAQRADAVLVHLTEILAHEAARFGDRALALGIAVPGLTAGTRVLDASMLGWREVELAGLGSGLPVVAHNDATMAAVAEARARRPASGALLHIVLEVGIGGALVVDGRPLEGAHSLAGEFGHMPFGDPGDVCGCGARGCWGQQFDPGRLARRLDEPEPADPRAWLREVFSGRDPSVERRRLREELAGSLGRGIAGLVNAMDPEAVTLGGLAAALRDGAPGDFDRAFDAGLMDTHRRVGVEVSPARAGEDAALVGLALAAFDYVLDAARLARWAAR